MRKVSFSCDNCGEIKEENIMPMKHAVLGTAYRLNKEAGCCVSPEYVDGHGYVKSMEKSHWDFIPGITP